MYKSLAPAFSFLLNEAAPKILVEALKDHGLHEVPGVASSPRIEEMIRQAKAKSYFPSDAYPWCALAMNAWALQAGYAPPRDPLAAKSWATFGTRIPLGEAMLGDILVMARTGGNHVTMYVAEKDGIYYGLGGNQADSVCIVGFEKSRITAIRRCPWKVGQPANVRKIHIGAGGAAHTSEA